MLFVQTDLPIVGICEITISEGHMRQSLLITVLAQLCAR